MASYAVDANAASWLAAQSATLFQLDPSSVAPHYQKYSIFTDPFFRQFSKILYLDSDTTVALPIHPFFALHLPPDVWIAMRDNGPGVDKGSLHENEFAAPLDIPDKRNPGATCAFLLHVDLLPNPRFLSSLLQTLTSVLASSMRSSLFVSLRLYDQPILHVLFLENFAVFAPCMPIEVVGSNEVAERLWTREHCRGQQEIFTHDYEKTCMSGPHNLFTEGHKAHRYADPDTVVGKVVGWVRYVDAIVRPRAESVA